MNEIKNVPELRFSEFPDAWQEIPLGNLGRFMGGGTPSTSNLSYWDGDIPWVSSSDVLDGVVNGLKPTRFITDTAVKDSATKLISSNSILFVSRVGVGKLSVNETPVCTSQDFTSLVPTKDDSYFIAYSFISKPNLLKRYSQGTSIKGFTNKDISALKVLLPKIEEQQKIADFLSSVDKKIEQLTEKHRLLTQYKKGVMQQVFTQQIRFKDNQGNDYPEWVGCLLGDHFEVGSSKRVLQEDWVSSGIPFLRTRELVSLSKKQPFSSEIFISPKLFKELSDKYGVPVEGDFLVSGVGTLGIHYQVKASDKFYFKDGNVLWLKRKPTINAVFFNFSFQSSFVQSQIVAQASTTTVGTYTIQNAKKTKLLVPKSLEEQEKIANFLTEIDHKINQAWSTLEQTKAFKKGLLQKMFV